MSFLVTFYFHLLKFPNLHLDFAAIFGKLWYIEKVSKHKYIVLHIVMSKYAAATTQTKK